MFKIQTLNSIAPIGLNQFPRELYEVSSDMHQPDAILVRSHSMHDMLIPTTVKAVGRAGAGLNNIPVAQLTKRGIPVFNTPGANANAVCELVIAGMLLASRNICDAWRYVNQLQLPDHELHLEIEKNKKNFVGSELLGKTLGIIGLGSIGVKVANAAINLGMDVIGYDPAITVHRAWELSAKVKQAHSIDDLLLASDFVSFHIPLTDDTRHVINHSRLQLAKQDIVLLNFARDGIIDNHALLQALSEKKIRYYVTDFPTMLLKDHPRVINLPHLGASTQEAEENCAVMIAKQIRVFLETGSILHAVNFPQLDVPNNLCCSRLLIANLNIPNMVAQISAQLAQAGLNIVSLLNKSRDDIAYTVIDLQSEVSENVANDIASIPGVMQLRIINQQQDRRNHQCEVQLKDSVQQ